MIKKIILTFLIILFSLPLYGVGRIRNGLIISYDDTTTIQMTYESILYDNYFGPFIMNGGTLFGKGYSWAYTNSSGMFYKYHATKDSIIFKLGTDYPIVMVGTDTIYFNYPVKFSNGSFQNTDYFFTSIDTAVVMGEDSLDLFYNGSGMNAIIDSMRLESGQNGFELVVRKRAAGGGTTALIDTLNATTAGSAMYYTVASACTLTNTQYLYFMKTDSVGSFSIYGWVRYVP